MRGDMVVTACVVGLLVATPVRADEAAPPSPAQPAPMQPDPEEPSQIRVTASIDLIGVVLDRYGVSLEAALFKHMSLVLQPFYLRTETDGDCNIGDAILPSDGPRYEPKCDAQTSAAGVDAQWRFYVPLKKGAVGPSGAFFAPGLEYQRFHVTSLHECNPSASGTSGCPPSEDQSWTYYGVSLDAGGQIVFGFGGLIGASIGIHYRIPTHSIDDENLPWTWGFSHGTGIRPRARVFVGWGF